VKNHLREKLEWFIDVDTTSTRRKADVVKPMLLLPEENESKLPDKGAPEDDMTKVKSTKYGLCS